MLVPELACDRKALLEQLLTPTHVAPEGRDEAEVEQCLLLAVPVAELAIDREALLVVPLGRPVIVLPVGQAAGGDVCLGPCRGSLARHPQHVLQPLPSLAEAAPQVPEAPQRGGEPQERGRVAALKRPV